MKMIVNCDHVMIISVYLRGPCHSWPKVRCELQHLYRWQLFSLKYLHSSDCFAKEKKELTGSERFTGVGTELSTVGRQVHRRPSLHVGHSLSVFIHRH